MRVRHRRRMARHVAPALIATIALLLLLVPGGVAAPSGLVSGTLEMEGVRTEAAVAVVTIVDQSASATDPLIVGQQRLPAPGAGPLPFTVRYDPARIDPKRSYAVYATVVDGLVVLASPAPVPVITGGPEADVKVPLVLPLPGTATLTVTVTKPDRTALSDAAVAQVVIVNTTGGRLAARGISVTTGQAPITVAVPYEPALVDPAARYVVKAAIVDNGSVWESVPVEIVTGSGGALTVPVTALPTGIPVIAPSPQPSASPAAPTDTPAPTPEPTATPVPTATPAPTATPEPTATPTPTPTPAPTPTPDPSATATPQPAEGTVTGTLVYAEGATLSGGARAVVALLDEGNASSVAVVATQVIQTPGLQPIAFSIAYATADIDPDRTYTIRGAIVDGDNAWVSAEGVEVVTGGAPSSGVVVRLTFRPDLLLGEVSGTLTGIEGSLGEDASSVTMIVQQETGVVLGFDARPQGGASAPIPFAVPFNVAEVDPDAAYVVVADVTDGDRSWETMNPPAVITDGNPFVDVAVVLATVATPTPSPSPTPMPSATPAPVPLPADEEGGPPWVLLLALVAGIGIAAAVIVARRGAKPSPTAPAGDEAAAGAEAPPPDDGAATGPEPETGTERPASTEGGGD